MLRHDEIWDAIDRLAHDRGLTASGLARRAGLDPTTFNRSKRITREGKPRWPGTESISKVLQATGCSMAEFVALLGREPKVASCRHVPLIGLRQVRDFAAFDSSGRLRRDHPDEISFPELDDPTTCAMEVEGDEMEPVYHDGDVLVLSPAATVRRGDRVLVRTSDGALAAMRLHRRGSLRLQLMPLHHTQQPLSLPAIEVTWLARILWASQ